MERGYLNSCKVDMHKNIILLVELEMASFRSMLFIIDLVRYYSVSIKEDKGIKNGELLFLSKIAILFKYDFFLIEIT